MKVHAKKENYHQVFMCMSGSTLEQFASLNKLMGTDKADLYSPFAN